jgi:hypothetical protein
MICSFRKIQLAKELKKKEKTLWEVTFQDILIYNGLPS